MRVQAARPRLCLWKAPMQAAQAAHRTGREMLPTGKMRCAAPGSLGVVLAVAGVAAGAGGALAAGAGSISIFTGGGGGWGGSWVSCVSIGLLSSRVSTSTAFGLRGARFAVGLFSGLRGARVLRAGLSLLASFTEALTKPLRGSEGKLARF